MFWNNQEGSTSLTRRLSGFKSKIHVKRIADASTNGVNFLNELRRLENEGIDGTFTYAIQFLDYEMWQTFTDEMTLCVSLSLAVILSIIMIISSNLTVTVLVGFCVGVTDLFLFGLIYYWNLSLNPVILVHIVVSVGISVDYSAHIAYAFLVEEVPEGEGYDTPGQVRVYKAKMALRKMGSSVFHGGFSTFIAILVLAPAKNYIFVVFFRLWFGIISFGMANGFILLPVILSFVGPTQTILESSNLSDSSTAESYGSTKPINKNKVQPEEDIKVIDLLDIVSNDTYKEEISEVTSNNKDMVNAV